MTDAYIPNPINAHILTRDSNAAKYVTDSTAFRAPIDIGVSVICCDYSFEGTNKQL